MLTRRELEDLGYHVPPGGGLATCSAIQEFAEQPKREGPEPLPQWQIDAMVASFPAPTKDPATMPRVLGCDPSLNEAGFAELGGPFGTVRVGEFRSRQGQERGEKVLALASFAADFAGAGFTQDVVVVEGTFYRKSRGVSPEKICAYGEAVGAVQGALRVACPKAIILRVEPDWMPEVLMGKGFGESAKEDRHRIAAGLFARAGLEWPGGSGHEKDACCQAAAWLAREGWV